MHRRWPGEEEFDVRDLLERIFYSRWFEIDIELPPGFTMSGRVPFDVVIDGEVATFRVLAQDPDDATAKVFDWLIDYEGD